ncbi:MULTISPECIES: MarR family winged helix-turn-helix transcriptional regulator [Micromonospora]|uniref:MarR family transcriptional regulator n=2 Tax=Micromonospora TaxID=1873 RepID=A0A9X0I7E4_9ACTN|nr:MULTISPECIES: MarR family transcriptional regulator [Micromonospora]AEB42882.1 regulatory protein MarR [Micromonospora maris AB-18-032]KUJ48282.1 MarR family transcriptional regulator [Micromonospora maris]MBL6278906.1 MarR family transcriptional regulator [Micromonospora fiedleri]WSK43914.1 MarR family transcriptional regulator [Micromonospora maris]
MKLVQLGDVPLGRLLVVAGHLTGQRWNRYLADEHGLTQAGMVTLMALAEHGELPHRAVAELCFVRPATLTGIVDTLERDGLVQRRRDGADRRSIKLTLTPDGRDRVDALTAMIRARRPLTSVDADPAKAAVIRQFLLEVIGQDESAGKPEGGPTC